MDPAIVAALDELIIWKQAFASHRAQEILALEARLLHLREEDSQASKDMDALIAARDGLSDSIKSSPTAIAPIF